MPDLDMKAAAARCGVHPMTVRRWVSTGLLPAHRVGPKLIRIKAEDLDAMTKAPV